MKKLTNVFLCFVLLFSVTGWTKIGLNFRSTAGFVSDGTDETYVLGETTGTTRGGVTFSWDVCSDCKRDRNSGIDRRLAGLYRKDNNGTQAVFTVTLSQTGTYKICLALGDNDNPVTNLRADVFDNTTLLFTVNDVSGPTNAHWDDATGTDRTLAAWPGKQSSLASPTGDDAGCQTGQVFATTTLKMKVGALTSTGDSTPVSHLYIECTSCGAAATSVPVLQAIGAL